VGMTAMVLGIPKASRSNWVRSSESGQLGGAGERPVTPEQMELARLRAELARVKMERDIAKEAAAYFAQDVLQSTPGSAR
jgi:transposase